MAWTIDPIDILTEDEAKLAVMGVKGRTSGSDDRLNAVNTAISERIDELCGAVICRLVTAELHTGPTRAVWLRVGPATQITRVAEYVGTVGVELTETTLTNLPGSGWRGEREPRNPALYSGRIERRSSSYASVFVGDVVVNYNAGRFADNDPQTGIAKFKEAAAIMLENWWPSISNNAIKVGEYDLPGNRFPSFAVPNSARQLLRNDLRETPVLA